MSESENEKKHAEYEEFILYIRYDEKNKQFVKRKRKDVPKRPNFKPISERFKKEIEWPLQRIPHSERLLMAAPYMKRDNAINDAYNSKRIMQSIHTRVYPEELNAVGAFSFMCSLVEGRIHAMYEARRALIQGIDITREKERESHYLFLETGSKELNFFISLEEAVQMLYRYSDIDQAFIDEIRIYQRIRNPLTHEAFLRREHFTHDILVGLIKLYGIFQKYRASQNNMIKRERKIFSNDYTNNHEFPNFIQGNFYTRVEIYQRLGGGLGEVLCAPFRNGKPAYVIMPRVESNGLQLKSAYVGCGDVFQEKESFNIIVPYFIDGGKSEKHRFEGLREVKILKKSKDLMCIQAISL